MKEKSLKFIIALITFAVIGLITIQFFWIKLALKLEEEKFNKNVGFALNDLVKQIETKETAEVMVKIISPQNDKIYLGKDKNNTQKKIVKRKEYLKNNVLVFNSDDSSVVTVNVEGKNDSNFSTMKVVKNLSANGDSTVQETIIWNGNLDTLIHKKTKIIENVFNDLVFSEKSENILNRINELNNLLLVALHCG